MLTRSAFALTMQQVNARPLEALLYDGGHYQPIQKAKL